MKISVIIPCYRCETTIERCAKSLFEQTYRECEFLFVDDGGDVSNLAEVVSRDSRARRIVIPHGGASAARNAGIREATGEYVTFCDSDDYMGQRLLERYVRAFQNTKADLVFTDTGDEVGKTSNLPTLSCYEDYFRSLFVGGGITAVVWDKCYRLKTIKENHINFAEGYDMWEDWRFNVEYALKCKSIQKAESIDAKIDCYHYIGHPGSLSNSKPALKTALAACENVRGIENALRQAGKLTPEYIGYLEGGKIGAKGYFLSVGTREALVSYRKTFLETNSVPLIWRCTRGKSLAYRIRHLCAIFHCFWMYRIAYRLTHTGR